MAIVAAFETLPRDSTGIPYVSYQNATKANSYITIEAATVHPFSKR
jgi:hypothetical protein